jgi:alpha-glucosidase
MTEVYYKSYNYYHYGSDIPFNFDFITYIDSNSKPSDFKVIIDTWIAAVPQKGVANWVVRFIS